MAVFTLPFAQYTDMPSFFYQVVLDGEQWRLRYVWRERLASWYLDVRNSDGEDVLLSRRLSPRASPNLGVTIHGPKGAIYAYGAEPYGRHDLDVLYLDASELPAFALSPPQVSDVRLAGDLAPAEVATGVVGIGGSLGGGSIVGVTR